MPKKAVLGAAKLARKRASAWAAADSESEEEPTWKAAFTGVAAPETTYSGSTRTYIGKVGRMLRNGQSIIECQTIVVMYTGNATCLQEDLPEGSKRGDSVRFEVEEFPGELRPPRAVNLELLGQGKQQAAAAPQKGSSKGKASALQASRSYSGVITQKDKNTGNLVIDCKALVKEHGTYPILRQQDNSMNARVGSTIVFKVKRWKGDALAACEVFVSGFNDKVAQQQLSAPEGWLEDDGWDEEDAWQEEMPQKKRKTRPQDEEAWPSWEQSGTQHKQTQPKHQTAAGTRVISTVVRTGRKAA